MSVSNACTFDRVADQYEQQLQQGLSLSGESSDYFVNGRIRWLQSALTRQNFPCPQRVLDFGCGVGNAMQALANCCQTEQVLGLDCSLASIRQAEKRYQNRPFTWLTDVHSIPSASLDLVHTSGVFHHIEPLERPEALEGIRTALKPGGLFAFFENNPLNPGTRWVMSRIPFDQDAQCLTPWHAKNLLRSNGFEIVDCKSLFYFPKRLNWLRPLEKYLESVPLGAQYVVLARRSASS